MRAWPDIVVISMNVKQSGDDNDKVEFNFVEDVLVFIEKKMCSSIVIVMIKRKVTMMKWHHIDLGGACSFCSRVDVLTNDHGQDEIVIDEEIESSALRAKYLEFDFRLVSDLFQELMMSIENIWFEMNEKIATVFEDCPLMKNGVELFKQK